MNSPIAHSLRTNSKCQSHLHTCAYIHVYQADQN